MSKIEKEKEPIESLSVIGGLSKEVRSIRTFRDKVYTARTLILPSGAALPVAKGRVNATTDDQLQYLSTHPDFERLTE